MYIHKYIQTKTRLDYTDTYNNQHKIYQALKRIPKREMREFIEDKLLYQKFGTVRKTAEYLSRFLHEVDKPIDNITKEDIKGFIKKTHQQGLSNNTLNTYRSSIRSFFNWLERPDLTAWFHYNHNGFKHEKYTSIEDIKKFIANCESLEEKAFFSVLWEANLRTSELISLKREDIEIQNSFILLYIDGKTGERTIPILRKGKVFPLGSFSLLKQHLKNVEGDQIWSIISYNQAQYRVTKIKRKVNLPWFHLHIFRKSRFTYNNEINIPYAISCIFGGWVPHSRVTQAYLLSYGQHLIPTLKRFN